MKIKAHYYNCKDSDSRVPWFGDYLGPVLRGKIDRRWALGPVGWNEGDVRIHTLLETMIEFLFLTMTVLTIWLYNRDSAQFTLLVTAFLWFIKS